MNTLTDMVCINVIMILCDIAIQGDWIRYE